MKAKDKVKEIIENIKGKKENKTTIENTNTINIIEKNQEEADKILQDEQAAKDDYDYMRIIEMDQADIPSDFEKDGMDTE